MATTLQCDIIYKQNSVYKTYSQYTTSFTFVASYCFAADITANRLLAKYPNIDQVAT